MADKVQRYTPDLMYIGDHLNIAVMDESDYGDYVHYLDYAKLETELRDTKKALELLYEEVKKSGNASKKDFGWPTAVAAAKAVLRRRASMAL